jgi:hypothetical protein
MKIEHDDMHEYTIIADDCEGLAFQALVLDDKNDELRIEFIGFDGGAYSKGQAQCAMGVIAKAIEVEAK